MDKAQATQIIGTIDASLSLIEALWPLLTHGIQTGQVTPEQQQVVRNRYLSLRNAGDAAFTGPEWDVT